MNERSHSASPSNMGGFPENDVSGIHIRVAICVDG